MPRKWFVIFFFRLKDIIITSLSLFLIYYMVIRALTENEQSCDALKDVGKA